MRLGIVASRFNEAIAGELLERARAQARKLGIEFEEKSVPGALEIPVALQWMAQSGRYDALVAVGAVIRGDTYHFELVCNESARGVMICSSSPLRSSTPRSRASTNLASTLSKSSSERAASTGSPPDSCQA